MQLRLFCDGKCTTIDVTAGMTVLDVLAQQQIAFAAPCGGNGKCGKCRVLVKTAAGLDYHLACQTEVEEGMEVILEQKQAMLVHEEGDAVRFAVSSEEEGTYGIAVDVGTTTVVCHLHDLATGERIATASCANPQMVFGADVISRITAASEGKLETMQEVLLSCLDNLVDQLCEEAQNAGIEVTRARITRMTLVGNTVMEHLATALSPKTIGVSPFAPLSLFGDTWELPILELKAYLAPAVSGYVGGDITAGMLASGFTQGERPQVFIDIGTNGEMAVGGAQRIVCCATAAGPAFEGAGIVFGMPAAAGGIERVDWVPAAGQAANPDAAEKPSLQLGVIGNSEPVGICGSGLIDALACMLRMGVVDETGLLLAREEAPVELADYLGEEAGVRVFYLTPSHSVYLTQRDIRNLQLAKAAICAGVLTLLEEYGITLDDVAGLMIAGGFGSHIRLESAARIGLFPRELLDRAFAVGNAAGEGAAALLVSQVARDSIATLAQRVEYVELSLHHGFNNYYIECMEFEEE